MAIIRDRYEFLTELEKGKPEIEISAIVNFESIPGLVIHA